MRAPDSDWPLTREHPRLRLVTTGSGEDLVGVVDPFAALHDRGGFSRALLVEIVGPGDRGIMFGVLKLQSDEYPTVATAEAGAWTNVTVEETWRREVELLERARGVRAGLPATVEVLSRVPGEPARLPPTILCKRRGAFFTAVCPGCGGPLADFRDDRALEDRGLPRYDSSLARFLACTGCLARGERTLYTLIRESIGGGRDVADLTELFRSYADLARTEVGAEGPRLPCQGCQHLSACYPAGSGGEATRVLTPLTFYESRCIVLEPLHLQFDEFSSLLGGARFEDVRKTAAAGRALLLDEVRPFFTDGPQYLFAQDAAGKLGLEVLRLKLTLFAQVVRGVVSLHRHTGGPHLGIHPARVMVALPAQRTDLPNLWNFRAALTGLGNAAPRPVRAGDPAQLPAGLFVGPRLIDPVFSAPPLRELPLVNQPGVLTLRRLTAAADGRVTLLAELAAETVDLAGLGDKDALEVSVVQARPPLSLSFLASPTGVAGRAVQLTSVPTRLDGDTRALLEQLVGEPLSRARFNLYRSLDVPCDVHGLGMLLFTALLANAAQAPGAVGQAVEGLASQVTIRSREHPRDDEIRAYAAELLSAGWPDGVFAKRQLFADRDRHAAADAVPDALWLDALLVALRAVTTIPGFSICRTFCDFDPEHREVKAEFLLALVESLIREVDTHLFGLPGRQREVRSAITRVADELRGARG